jgi:hypothetical protein
VMGRAQYDFEYKRYPHFEQFTHAEHNVCLTFSRRLHPAAEIFVSADYGHKTYTKTIFDTTFVVGSTGKGKGKGGVKSKVIISELTTPSADQLVLAAGVSGSIGSAEYALSYLKRLNPSNKARYVDRRDIAIDATEDAFFDDRYGYQSHEIDGRFGASLFWSMTLGIEGMFHRKTYPQTAANLTGENVAGDKQRVDLRSGIAIMLTRPVLKNAAGATLLTAGCGYRFLRNQSNDQYHDYNAHQAQLSVEASF